MLDRYMSRPDEKFQTGKFASANSLCYAEFLRYCYVSTISNENDWQFVELTDDILETNLPVTSHHSLVIPLMPSPDKLKCRKVPSVLKYFTLNKSRNYEVYVHHLLILFYQFGTESILKGENSYTKKVAARDAIDTVNRNRSIVELYCELANEALLRCNSELINSDEKVEENLFLNNDVLDDDNLENGDVSSINESDVTNFFEIKSSLLLQNDEEISESIQSLNVKQRQVFDHVLTWAKEKVKQKSSIKTNAAKPFNLFISGSVGVRKSHLIKTIYTSVTKLLQYHGGSPEKLQVLILEPTGVQVLASMAPQYIRH